VTNRLKSPAANLSSLRNWFHCLWLTPDLRPGPSYAAASRLGHLRDEKFSSAFWGGLVRGGLWRVSPRLRGRVRICSDYILAEFADTTR
jgi:hypothetical protein